MTFISSYSIFSLNNNSFVPTKPSFRNLLRSSIEVSLNFISFPSQLYNCQYKGDCRRRLIFFICLLKILWNWFLMALSVLPTISLEIRAHLFPYLFMQLKYFYFFLFSNRILSYLRV